MKKINLLVALTLSLNVFSQEMKKDTTHKKITKLENGSHYDNIQTITFKIEGDVQRRTCQGVSKKGVKCPLPVTCSGFYCMTRMCLRHK